MLCIQEVENGESGEMREIDRERGVDYVTTYVYMHCVVEMGW